MLVGLKRMDAWMDSSVLAFWVPVCLCCDVMCDVSSAPPSTASHPGVNQWGIISPYPRLVFLFLLPLAQGSHWASYMVLGWAGLGRAGLGRAIVSHESGEEPQAQRELLMTGGFIWSRDISQKVGPGPCGSRALLVRVGRGTKTKTSKTKQCNLDGGPSACNKFGGDWSSCRVWLVSVQDPAACGEMDRLFHQLQRGPNILFDRSSMILHPSSAARRGRATRLCFVTAGLHNTTYGYRLARTGRMRISRNSKQSMHTYNIRA